MSQITGYRQLTDEETALINEGKDLAALVGVYISKLRMHRNSGSGNAIGNTDGCLPALDQRWISIGATDLQRGFMAVTRGIAQPTTF